MYTFRLPICMVHRVVRSLSGLIVALASNFAFTAAAAEHWHFGLPPPSAQPRLFEPALFESLAPFGIANPTFSPDLRRLVFTAVDTRMKDRVLLDLYETHHDGRTWSRPVRVLHADGFNTTEAAFTLDGKSLYFTSNRPPGELPWRMHVFRAVVSANDFGSIEPVVLEAPAQGGFFFPQLLGNGDLVLTSRSARGDDDLFIARARSGGGFERPEALSGDFNSDHDDWDLVEDRSASVRVWASSRPGGAGKTDIYMSRRTTQGQWSEARNVVAVNSPGLETAPRLTPDGDVLFFQRRANGVERLFWIRLDTIPE